MWQDRLTPASYTNAQGEVAAFEYEQLELSQDVNGASFESPDNDGTYVQKTSVAGRRFSFRAYIFGENYDLDSAEFLRILTSPGTGTLSHPYYGNLPVIPFGRIKRRDDLVTSAGESVFEVTFWETNESVAVNATPDQSSIIFTNISDVNNAISEEYAEAVDPVTELKKVTISEQVKAEVLRSGIDMPELLDQLPSLATDPITLALMWVNAVQAQAYEKVEEVRFYIESMKATLGYTGADFPTDRLFSQGYHSATAISRAVSVYATRDSALQSAYGALSDYEDLTNITEEANPDIDYGASYEATRTLVLNTVRYLIGEAFSLAKEVSIVTDRDRTPLDLAFELYGDVEQTGYLIDTNQLAGKNIIEIPAGTEIVYYV